MIVPAAASAGDVLILTRACLRRTLWQLFREKAERKAVKPIVIRGSLLPEANGFSAEYKREEKKKGNNWWNGSLICSLLPAFASLKLHYVMHKCRAAHNMT